MGKGSKEKNITKVVEKKQIYLNKNTPLMLVSCRLVGPMVLWGRHLAIVPCVGEAKEPELTRPSLVVRHQSHMPSGAVTPLAHAVGCCYSSRSRGPVPLLLSLTRSGAVTPLARAVWCRYSSCSRDTLDQE